MTPRPAFGDRWARYFLARQRQVLVLTSLFALALVPGLARLETDNSPSVFFVRGSDDLTRYDDFRAEFGSDHAVRMAFDGPGLWTTEGMAYLEEVEERAAAAEGVVEVSGLASHHGRSGWPPADPEALRQLALDNALDRSAGWISQDGDIVTVLALLEADGPLAEPALAAFADIVDEAPAGVRGIIVGLPVLNRALDRSSREIDRRYFPLLVVFTLLILFVTVRDVADLVAPLVFVGLCQLMVLGPMGYTGSDLNLVLAMLPPIIFVISLATALHLLLRYRQLAETCASRTERVRDAMREKRWAMLWTGITTSVGFASLATSPLGPVRSLGWWAAIGLLAMTAASFLVLPALLASFGAHAPCGDRTGHLERRASSWGARWATFACRRRRWVLGATLVMAFIGLLGLTRLEVESNALHYLPPDHSLRVGIERLESAGIGVAAVELLVAWPERQGGAPPALRSALEVDRLAVLADELERAPEILGAIGAGAVLRDASASIVTMALTDDMRRQMVLEGIESDDLGRRVLRSMVSEDRSTARVTVFVSTAEPGRIDPLLDRILAIAQRNIPEAEVAITGQYPLLLAATGYLISTLVISLALTLVVIAIVLRILLPSSRLTLLAVVPNLWPVLAVLGVMGWCGVPLDIATVMVASVVLGLAVDDTIHTLGHFRELAPRHGNLGAAVKTLELTAPAYLLTGLVLCAGFAVCSLSDFAPIARFGGLSAVAIFFAVLGDLLLLPALLSLTPGRAIEKLGDHAADRARRRGEPPPHDLLGRDSS
ncbi:MAG: MMPL family transporter [Acidobacteriota bacterium]